MNLPSSVKTKAPLSVMIKFEPGGGKTALLAAPIVKGDILIGSLSVKFIPNGTLNIAIISNSYKVAQFGIQRKRMDLLRQP